MESFLRSLRNLSLSLPSPSQLLSLLDQDVDKRNRLAQLLALNVSNLRTNDEDVDSQGMQGMSAADFMGQDLLREAVGASLDNFGRELERQKGHWEREAQLLLKPQKHKPVPRKALLLRQAADLRRHAEEREQSRGFWPKLVFDGGPSYHSDKELQGLRRVGVRELDRVPARYEGTYLLCRVLTPLNPYVGVSLIVEDPCGDALSLSIAHFTSDYNASVEGISASLPLGTILAIKEPYLSTDHLARTGPCTGKASNGVRVDSPTDVIVLRPEEDGEGRFKDVEWKGNLDDFQDLTKMSLKATQGEGKVQGLEWMEDGPLSRAIRAGKTSATADAMKTKELVNALLRRERPGAAWRELCAARKLGVLKLEEDTQLLEARTLFIMGAFEEAAGIFEKIGATTGTPSGESDVMPDPLTSILDIPPSQAHSLCLSLLSQSKAGPSPSTIRSFYFSSTSTPVPRLSLSSPFIGPVQISLIDGAYRGLITTRDTFPGEILLCCRAVAAAYPDDEESRGSPTMRLNLENGVVSTTSQVRAQTRVVHALVDRPELALPFMGLTAGPQTPYSKWATQPYPLRVPPVIEASAAFEQVKHRLDIDASYVDGVLRFNAFGPAQAPPSKKSGESKSSSSPSSSSSSADAGELGRSTMPHPLPAILNHACLPNVSSVFFGDVVVTRVLNPLPSGTEIVHQYVRGEEAYAVRSAQLSKHGFECRCGLCERDRGDGEERRARRGRIVAGELPAVLERSRVVLKGRLASEEELGKGGKMVRDEMEKRREANRDVVEALEGMVRRLEETYGEERDGLRPELFQVLEAKARHLRAVGDVEGAMQSEIQALQCVGAELSSTSSPALQMTPALIRLPTLHFDGAISVMLRLAALSTSRSAQSTGATPREWMDTAFGAHQCMIGGGIDVFCDRWEEEEAAWERVLREWREERERGEEGE